MTNPKIIIHAGHGKTGTSALQSSLALSQDNLLRRGIAYPDHPSFAAARAGQISSGNLEPDDIIASYDDACRKYRGATTVLYSNEHFFTPLVDRPDFLTPLLSRGVSIEVILFTRNPFEHAVSAYVQKVKRKGLMLSLEKFLALYDRPERVLKLLENAAGQGVQVVVRNYSRHKGALKPAFAEAVGVAPSDLADPPREIVNRSLTRSELRLQRAFNAVCGRQSSAFISDPLCNELPNVKGSKPGVSRAVFERFVQDMHDSTAAVNERLSEAERYQPESYEDFHSAEGDADPDAFEFSAAQLDVLARAIARQIDDTATGSAPDPKDTGTPAHGAVRQFFQRVLSRS